MSAPKFPTDAKILANQMKSTLDEVERGRLHSLARIGTGWKKIGIAVLIMVVLGVLLFTISAATSPSGPGPYSNEGFPTGFLVLPVIFIGVIYCVVIHSKYIGGHKSVYRAVYKEKIIAGLTRLIQPEMLYSPERGISEHTFREMGLYSSDIDRYHCEDLFAGKIGKTEMMFSEAHAEERRRRTDSKGKTQTYWVTIFRGLLAIADFNKHFRSWVVVKPDFAESTFGWFGKKIQGFNPDLIRLENPVFEKAFVVYGNDQVEARYILTPDMQERLLELRRWFGDDIRIAFHSSRMHLSIPNTDNWFEPDINRSAHDTTQMQTFLRQMSSIFKLVEILDLNTRIWTKE